MNDTKFNKQLTDLLTQYGLPERAIEYFKDKMQPLLIDWYMKGYKKGQIDAMREVYENHEDN